MEYEVRFFSIHWKNSEYIFPQEVHAPVIRRKPSATLTAMGLSRADVESTVRISFCEENTFEEVDYCLEALGKTIPMLRRYARR